MAKGQFSFIEDYSSKVDEQGKIRLYSDEQRKQFKLEEEAKTKIRETQALKLQIQQETDIAVGEALAEKKKKSGFIMETLGGIQTYSDPRNWGRGLLKVGSMIIENPKDVFVDAPRGASQAKNATKLFEQSSQLNTEATRLSKTDKVKSDELFKQSQELYKSAQEQYGKADENLGQLTTSKQIAAKAALTGLDIGSLLPGGAGVKAAVQGGIKGAPLLSKVVTKVPEAVQTTKTFSAGNIFSSLLGLGDIYQGGAKVVSRATGKEAGKGIVGLTTDAIGMGIKNTAQAPVYGTLQALADNEDDSFENIKNNILTTGVSVFGLTLGFGFAGNILADSVAGSIAKNAANKGNVTPAIDAMDAAVNKAKQEFKANRVKELQRQKEQGLWEGFDSIPNNPLGAFNPETDIPIVDLTKTVKGNNIDFNPDSATSVNSTRNAVDKLAMLSGNQVAGKAINIDKNDPKYKEIFDTMIKPLTDSINRVDEGLDVPNVKVDPLVEEARKYKSADEFLKTQGEPVYHGTNVEFKKFDPKKINTIEGSGDYVGSGFYFTNSVDKAKKYSLQAVKKSGGKEVIKEAYLEIKNPLIINSKDDISKLNNLFGGEESRIELLIDNPNAVKEKLQSLGYDGLIDNVYGQRAVFDTNQIKTKSQLEDIYNKAQSQPETPTLSKIPIEEVELKVNEIETQLRNAGIDTNPASVADTPNIDIVDEKLARGETPTPEELDKGAKEYIENTGNPEVIAGVKQETQDRLKNSTFFGRFAAKNPEAAKNTPNPQYIAQNMADEEKYAKDLVENNFEKAKEIVDNLKKADVQQGNQNKITQEYIAKLLELGKDDEAGTIAAKLSDAGTDAGQLIAAFRSSSIADPVLNITKATRARRDAMSKEVAKEVKTVKEKISSVIIDDSTFASILDNITCK